MWPGQTMITNLIQMMVRWKVGCCLLEKCSKPIKTPEKENWQISKFQREKSLTSIDVQIKVHLATRWEKQCWWWRWWWWFSMMMIMGKLQTEEKKLWKYRIQINTKYRIQMNGISWKRTQNQLFLLILPLVYLEANCICGHKKFHFRGRNGIWYKIQ